MPSIAIVTGASSGIGRAFAELLDERRAADELWLIARRAERLEAVAGALKHSRGVPVPLDLGRPDAHEELAARLAATPDTNVRWLINNAGFGQFGRFETADLQRQLAMIDLNVRAPVALTHVALPHMRAGGRIVHVASSAAFAPLPALSVYAATKAFLLYFSAATRAELKRRGVHVTCVCPGPVRTEFQAVAEVPKTADPDIAYAEPLDVARAALDAAEKNNATSVYGLAMKAYRALIGPLPVTTMPALQKLVFKSARRSD